MFLELRFQNVRNLTLFLDFAKIIDGGTYLEFDDEDSREWT